MSEFQVDDKVLIFADDEGFYRAEQSSVPVLRRAVITSEADEDGDYLVKVDGMDAKYANHNRILPLETILIGGKPFFVGQRAISAEELFGRASDSDGGVDLNMSVNPFPKRHDNKEDPTVGPNEDAYYGPSEGDHEPLAEVPEITFTLEQVVALLNALKSEV